LKFKWLPQLINLTVAEKLLKQIGQMYMVNARLWPTISAI